MEERRAVISQAWEEIVTTKANQLARETGFLKRQRAFSGADVVQSLICGWWQEPDISFRGLTQVLSRCEVAVTPSELTQRFGKASAELMRQMLVEVSSLGLSLQAEPDLPLLRPCSAVIVEDRSVISLPCELIGSGRDLARVEPGSRALCAGMCSTERWRGRS